jgi:hypothetical protein
MSTLLAVLSHSAANDRVFHGWRWYERAGCDILGVGRFDTRVLWPVSPRLVATLDSGAESYVCGDNHLKRFLSTLEYFLVEPLVRHYDAILVTEYDVIFPRPLPAHTGGLITALAGHRSEGFLSENFYHSPWWVDRPTANAMLTFGQRLLKLQMIEHGFIDRWIGLLAELYDIPVTAANAYTQNSIDRPQFISEAREAITKGAYCVHGLKTMDQVRAVTEGLPLFV